MIGRIPPDDVKFPHTQTFNKLLSEIYRTKSLVDTSGHVHFAVFASPDIHHGLNEYKRKIDAWLEVSRSMNFDTTEDMVDWIEVSSCLTFIRKDVQDPGLTKTAHHLYLACHQRVCTDMINNTAPCCTVWDNRLLRPPAPSAPKSWAKSRHGRQRKKIGPSVAGDCHRRLHEQY